MPPNIINKLPHSLNELKSKILNPILLIFSILSIPLLFGSIYRTVFTGWKWIYLFHVIMTILIWNILFFRKKISSGNKAIIIIIILILIACLGLYDFGILGNGKLFFIVSIIFTGIFIGRKQAFILSGVVFFILVIFAFLFISNRLHYNFNTESYITQPTIWVTAIITLIAVTIGLQLINDKYIEFFIKSDRIIRESEEKFRDFFNHSGDAIVISNFNLFILDINQTALKIIGLTKEEVVGEKTSRFLTDSSKNIMLERIQKMKTQNVSPVELEIMLSENVKIPVEINSKKIKYEGKDAILSVLRDLTERKKASQALIKSEERFRTLTSNIPGTVYRCKPKIPWHMEYVSDNIFDITGYSASGFTDGKVSIGNLICKDDLTDVNTEINNSIIERRPFRLEYRIEHTDGNIRWVMERGQAKYSNSGMPLWLDGVIFDITENKKAQQALQESEERYRIIADTSPDGITTTDLSGKITFTSQRILEMHGFENRDIILGLNAVDLIAESDRNLVVQDFQSTNEKGIVRDIECKLRKKDGTEFYGEVSAALLKNIENKPVGYLAITKDNSEKVESRKKLEEINEKLARKNTELMQAFEKLEENEKKYRTLFENANDGIFIMKNETFIMCNNKMQEIFKAGVEEIVGKTPADLSPEIQPDGSPSKSKANYFINNALSDQPQRFEWVHKRHGGEPFFAEVSLNKLILGEEIFLQAIVRDISEKKQLERKVLNAIIETEEKERGRFAMELHDGLGPLFSTIKLYTQSVQAEKDPEERKSVLDIIHNSVDEAISSLREISNNISPHILQNFGLNSAVNSFIEKIMKAKKINIQFSSNTDERFHEIIEITIYRVLIELINNTIKHALAKNITIQIKRSKNVLNILYDDDGKGIDLNNPDNTGGGMGIFNIENRIKSLNGFVAFESKKNKGIKVHILLNLDEIESLNN